MELTLSNIETVLSSDFIARSQVHHSELFKEVVKTCLDRLDDLGLGRTLPNVASTCAALLNECVIQQSIGWPGIATWNYLLPQSEDSYTKLVTDMVGLVARLRGTDQEDVIEDETRGVKIDNIIAYK